MSVANLSGKTDKETIDLLCYTMGEKSEEILTQVLPEVSSQTTYQLVKQKLNSYFSPKKNIIFERFKFNSRIQQPGESVDTCHGVIYLGGIL